MNLKIKTKAKMPFEMLEQELELLNVAEMQLNVGGSGHSFDIDRPTGVVIL